MAEVSTARTSNQGDQVRHRSHQHSREFQQGDGSTTVFVLQAPPKDADSLMVFVNGALFRPDDAAGAQDYSLTKGNIVTFAVAPVNGDDICFATIR